MNTTTVPSGVQNLMSGIVTEIINPIIGVLFALALLYFLYGLVTFIANADNVSKKGEAQSHMIWGLVGLVVMVSAWAIIQISLNTVGLSS